MGVFHNIQVSEGVMGKSEDSWKALFAVASAPFAGPENSFGYFVYSPDVYGYGPKYAMSYAEKVSTKDAYSFEKKEITYLILAPSPANLYMEDSWWRKNQLNLKQEPVSTIKFDNGYKVEKYILQDADISTPFDPAINPGIHFR